MKKIICFALSFVCLFSLFACGQTEVTPTTPITTENKAPESLPTKEVTVLPTEKPSIIHDFSDFIDINLEAYDNGRLSFLHLADNLTYNTQIISNTFPVIINENSNASDASIEKSTIFSFWEKYQLSDDGKAVNSARLIISKDVKGFSLPFEITFNSHIDDALKIFTDREFDPDEGSDTDMTIYSDETTTLVYSNLNATQSPGDSMDPFRIVYTNKYTYTNKNGFEVERLEKVSLNFDTFSDALSKVMIEVEDSYTVPVEYISIYKINPNEIFFPIPTETPIPYPTVQLPPI